MLNNIRETLIFGTECRERLLPLGEGAGESLRAIGVQMAGCSDLSAQYHVARREPPYHVVLVTTQGEGLLAIPGGGVLLTPGTITILPKGSIYEYSTAVPPWSVAWFHLANRPRWCQLSEPRTWTTHGGATLAALANVYMDEVAVGRFHVASMTARALARALDEILLAKPSGDSDSIERLRSVMRKVESDLGRRWTEAELAGLAHYSPQHFRRLAHQYWGTSPIKAVAKARMTRAMALLESSSLRLASIATAIGYADEFAFSTAFRRATGKSPTQWRQSASFTPP